MENNNQSFEALLDQISEIVKKMENGNLTLDEQISSYEKGVNLVGQCNKILQDAEVRVKKLTAQNQDGQPVEMPAQEYQK